MSLETVGVRTAVPLTPEALEERTARPVRRPPARIVHIGLGAFHRSHQAWFTAHAADADEWGIVAFTGRTAAAAEELAPQSGLYTLVQRAPERDDYEVLTDLVEAVDGADLVRFATLLSAEQTALVTITVTESGYRVRADHTVDTDDAAVAADVNWLTAALGTSDPLALSGGPATTLGRLLLGLELRHRSGGAPIAIVPCDNMPDNGPLVREGLLSLARLTGARSAQWIAEQVSFISTSVDRITPKTTPQDLRAVAEATGWIDAAAVVTEPFRDWILCGDFPAGRPRWEAAGARFVDDIEPFERRKLWLLNGAHSLLAYTGALRGHDTVAEAISDAACLRWVREFWDEAVRYLPAEGLGLDDYRAALLERFGNARIEHRLAQIGMEATTKLRVRVAPIVLAERAAGRDGEAGMRALGSWIALARRQPLVDAQQDQVLAALEIADATDSVARLLHLIDPELAAAADIVARVVQIAAE
ncbi:mannitol dehydrogenase family protein [Humibacter antri]